MWRARAALLFLGLGSTADAAQIVVTCHDGAAAANVRWTAPRTVARIAVCDLDGSEDRRCRFDVRLGGRSTDAVARFALTIPAGGRRRVHHDGTRLLLRCRRGPEPTSGGKPVEPPPGARVVTCQDAVLTDENADPACDIDRACDDVCTFGFRCLACCGCLLPCYRDPAYSTPVRVGKRHVVAGCARTGRPALVLECRPRPADIVCPTTTTSTTIPVFGACETDADCASMPEACRHCELGTCQGVPVIRPGGSTSTVICPAMP